MEFGILIHSNVGYYEGDWKNGKKDGNGLYVSSYGDKYTGQWKDDMQHDAQLVLKLIFIFDFWIL